MDVMPAAAQQLVQLVLGQAELMKLNKETDEMRKEAICVLGIMFQHP